MFGNISTTPSTNPGTSAFGTEFLPTYFFLSILLTGTFGGNPSTGNSVFGAPKPATGFGAFSAGTGAFGSGTSAFGQPATTSTASAFGQPSTSTSAFGGGSNLFGNKSAFGGTALTGKLNLHRFSKVVFSTFRYGTGTAPPTVTTGTANPAYAVTTEKDGATTLQFQSMTCMPAFVGYSFEVSQQRSFCLRYLINYKGTSDPGLCAG
jgi:nuclear pore complex protein Nup98-Nup96